MLLTNYLVYDTIPAMNLSAARDCYTFSTASTEYVTKGRMQ